MEVFYHYQYFASYLFWTDWTLPKIERSTMAGNLRTTIVETDLGWPNGLSIDNDEDMIYWADALRSGHLKKNSLTVFNFNNNFFLIVYSLPVIVLITSYLREREGSFIWTNLFEINAKE